MKKIICLLLFALVIAAFLCACGENKTNASSALTESEETKSETALSSTVSTISKNEESSNKEESSKIEASSEAETSSKKSNKVERPTASQSTSQTVKVSANQAVAITAYHFSPQWAENYGESEDDHYREFEDVLSNGYFNSVTTKWGHLLNPRFWEICKKYNVSVWMDTEKYVSSKRTWDQYMEYIDEYLVPIKNNPEWWELFQGFHWDEPVWNYQTNADFLYMTENLYKKYGKRNFPVLATGEFTGVEGNFIDTTDIENRKMVPESMKYLTDIGFDSYGVDVREGAANGSIIKETAKELPDVKDGVSYYKELTKLLLRMVGHDVNIWFFPCAYTTNLWGGLNGLGVADEEYCLAHLNFFHEYLMEFEHKGGIQLYTYYQWDEGKLGLQSHLVVKDENGEQTLRPSEAKWRKYSARLRELTEKYKNMNANPITKLS